MSSLLVREPMRPFVFFLALASSIPAGAHIKLTDPASFQITDFLGGPSKAAPCGGPGTPSEVVTTVQAGSQLTVTWTETILHPGHFRISIAPSPNDFVTPTATVINNNCVSAPVETEPVLPTLVDGLFPHTQSAPNNTYSTTVTVPMMSCENCTLQLLQFMSSHAPSCFYYQCAALRIVMPEQLPDGGFAPVEGLGPNKPPPGCGCSGSPPMLGVLGLMWVFRRKPQSSCQ